MYQGTQLVITCTVTVDSAVDTGFDVNLTWSSNRSEIMTGPYVTTTDTSDSGHNFTSTVTISPVDTTDSANYTCTASVAATATGSDLIISSMKSSNTMIIQVKGECHDFNGAQQ